MIIALLYYLGVFLLIHYEAQRFGEGRIDEADIVTLRVALKRWVAGNVFTVRDGRE